MKKILLFGQHINFLCGLILKPIQTLLLEFEDAHSFLKYHYTWKINSDKIKNKIIFFVEDLQIFTEFYPNLSWVRDMQKNDELLKYEQGHFDLAELVKINHLEKIQNKFYKKQFPTRGQNEEQRKQFAKEDSTKLIAFEIELKC